MRLEDSSIVKFKVAKEIGENSKRINSIDFSGDGRNLISSSDDESIIIYDCERGTRKREKIFSKKYGVDLVRYTHANNTAIHTSTKENDIIRYLSLHDNKYLRYFVGHEKRVTTLSMSPADDAFISGSLDQTVRLWDLKQDKCQGKLSFSGSPIANFDPEGLIFAVGINNEIVKFFDLRNHDKGPFNTIRLDPAPEPIQWESLKFSPDGRQILITTNCEELYVLDAFSGAPMHKLVLDTKPPTPVEYPCEASYTPDSQYIITGSTDGCLHIFSACDGKRLTILKPEKAKADPVQCVKFNPKYMMLASACSKMSLWIPVTED